MSRSLAGRLRRVSGAAWVVLVLLLGLALRLAALGEESLWFDEAFSWLVAQQPAWAILTQRLEPILPPLYHFLLHFWIDLGKSEAMLRLPSVLFGVMTIPIMYALGRDLFDPDVGLGAAFLAAVLPFHVYFSQEARLYALVILLSALMLWTFVRAWHGSRYREWIILGLLAGLSFLTHYFVAFSLAVLHGFALARWMRDLHRGIPKPFRGGIPKPFRGWRGLLLADLVIVLVAGPFLPSAWTQTQQVTTNFWLSSPSVLEPIKTLDYLLFGHTTPIWLIPMALFLTLSILALIVLAAIRVRGEARPWLFLLIALMLVPMLLALLLSWTLEPVFLDRSFSLVTPAYILLLSWGFVHTPRRSPLRLLYAGLAITIVVSLGNHYLKPDPAKPPFREVGELLNNHWQEKDTLLSLHDSSYLPLRYYAPRLESHLLNNDPDTWLPDYTWSWAGQRISSLDQVVGGKSRLWLVIMPARMNDCQVELLAEIESRYPMERERTWPSMDPVHVRLYALGSTNTGQ